MGGAEQQTAVVVRGTWAAEIRGGISLPWTEVTWHKGDYVGKPPVKWDHDVVFGAEQPP